MLLISTVKIALLFFLVFKSISTNPSISLNSPLTLLAKNIGISNSIDERFLSRNQVSFA